MGKGLPVAVFVRAYIEDEFGLQRVLLERHKRSRLQLAVLQKSQALNFSRVGAVYWQYLLPVLCLDQLNRAISQPVGQQLRWVMNGLQLGLNAIVLMGLVYYDWNTFWALKLMR